MGKYFGTDGVRGIANKELTPELALALGRAGAWFLRQQAEQGGAELRLARPRIIIGKDTRVSGDMLEAALTTGICSMGVDVVRVGVLPTPGVAYLTRSEQALAGVVISASHNPFADNGIKFFDGCGYKLADEVEAKIEETMERLAELPVLSGAELGRATYWHEGGDAYREHLLTLARPLTGCKIVADCANGAASRLGPQLLQELGATVLPIFDTPDGININDGCGSTHPETMARVVVAQGADIGLAWDGDADRLIACDEQGNILDGDYIMTICALARQRQGKCPGNVAVVTVMSNIGLYQALQRAGIDVHRTQVGDRYVMEELLATGALLGGEQSGHIIFSEHSTTGDGLLTAVYLLNVMQETGKPLSQLAAVMERFPQVLLNARVSDRDSAMSAPAVREKIKEVEEYLGTEGRLLVRPSGTEPLVRVMLEGRDQKDLQRLAEELITVIRNSAGT